MVHIGNHVFCVGRITEKGKLASTFFRKSDIIGDSVETKRMVSNTAFYGLKYQSGQGRRLKVRPWDPLLRFIVDLRRKSLEHAMHPLQGAADLRASPSAAGPLANSMT